MEEEMMETTEEEMMDDTMEETADEAAGGGCLIATAAYGTELRWGRVKVMRIGGPGQASCSEDFPIFALRQVNP